MGTIFDFVKATSDHIKYDGIKGVERSMWLIYNKVLGSMNSGLYSRYGGENIFESEWDLMIIIDACRIDLINCCDHSLLQNSNIDSRYSIAPNSTQFLQRTFTEDHIDNINNTAYITANPHSKMDISTPAPNHLDEIWRYAWDDDIGTVPAEVVTDRAISVGRQTDLDRYIIHYMQPHFPSIPHPEVGSKIKIDAVGNNWPDSVWKKLLKNIVSHQEVWEAYLSNLEYALDSIEVLLSNFDADKAIITSDHGNAMGERGFYGHQEFPVKEIWKVPWINMTATDTGSYDPETYNKTQNEIELKEQLSALGYQ